MSYPARFLMMIPMIAFAILTGCSSNVKKAEIPGDANAQTEVSNLEKDMSQALDNNVDVASPRNYQRAHKAFEKAKEMNAENKSREKILEQVAIARGALNEATTAATTTNEQLSDIMKARSDARAARAHELYKVQMAEEDHNLEAETWNFEKGKGSISQKKREALMKSYNELEAKALQKTHLGDARAMIDNAEKNGAKRYAPKTLASAKAKLRSAETVISNNRKDTVAIQAAAGEATAEAKKLMEINKNARMAKGLSAEEVALNLSAKDQELAQAGQQIQRRDEALQETASEREAALAAKDQELSAAGAALAATNAEKSELERREAFNAALTEAQKEFGKDEAEVYRQGDSLLIRLKSGTFASGSADLAGSAFTTLNKVNRVVSKIDAQKIVVEGHTDSVGSAEVNQKLSENRAKTVADFISSSNVVDKSQVESQGMSYEKPVATNKTREGRAQNRRVDIIITPKGIE